MLSFSQLARTAVTAAAIAALSGAAHAQCALEVKASPTVIMPGQSAKVSVKARFPVGAYAFANADFGVSAGTPSWSFITGGVIAGADVVGINATQPHQPQLGVMADPANPYAAWTGRFTPASYAPAYIPIKVTPAPGTFWYYPSMLTSSAAQCEPKGSETAVFVNPVRLGVFAAAPGVGGTIQTTDDSFVVSGGEGGVSVGLLLPLINPARESSARIQTGRGVFSLTFNGQTTASIPTDNLSLNFTKIEFRTITGTSGYKVLIDPTPGEQTKGTLTLMDGQEVPFEVRDGQAPFTVLNLPDTVVSRAALEERTGLVTLGWHFSVAPSGSSHPGGMNVLMMDGSVRMVRNVSVYSRIKCSNNLRQLGIAAHHFEAMGTDTLTVTPQQ